MITWREGVDDLPDVRLSTMQNIVWLHYPPDSVPTLRGPIVKHYPETAGRIVRVHYFKGKSRVHWLVTCAELILNDVWSGTIGIPRKWGEYWHYTWYLVAEMNTLDEALQFANGEAWRT